MNRTWIMSARNRFFIPADHRGKMKTTLYQRNNLHETYMNPIW